MPHAVSALLVGEIGAGKTTVCQRLAEALRRRGLPLGGIISQPRYDGQGRKRELYAVDLWSGQCRRLATVGAQAASDGPPAGLAQGPYVFDPATFAWAVQAVRVSLAHSPALVIVDEIGPLELEAQAGLAPLLGGALGACPTLLVVRRAWQAALEARLGVRPLVFEVLPATRDRLPEMIIAALCPRSFAFSNHLG